MRNVFLIFFAALMAFSFDLSAKEGDCATEAVEADWGCKWHCYFKGIKEGGKYQYGKPLYVECVPKYRYGYKDIQYVKLFVDGRHVRTEKQYPYQWGKGNSDVYLRKLSKGKHKITCKIYDRCGDWHEISCWIWIEGGHYPGPPTHGHCEYKCYYKFPKKDYHYGYGEPVYVNLASQGYQYIEYAELWCDGKYLGKESRYPYEWGGKNSRDSYWKTLQPGRHHLKCRVKDKCGNYEEYTCYFWVDGHHGGGNGGHGKCIWDCWFEYPKKGHCDYGRSSYVKIGAKSYKHIKYVELWCDGKYIRKETRAPYEWGKGGDPYLKRLRKGRHHLKCKIVDICGDEHWEEYDFEVS